MKNLKVVSLENGSLYFNNGMCLYSDHDQECCESHYLGFDDLTIADFEGLEFDLSNDNFFERLEDYGIALLPIKGHPVRIPGYSYNNGYYSADLTLILTKEDGREMLKEFDITECQKETY